MEVLIQKCQTCGSRELRNILVRGEQQKVFVQCRKCENLVARYILSAGGYYHAGKGFESFLRSIEREDTLSQGRNIDDVFNNVERSAKEEFEETIKQLKEKYTDTPP